MARIRTIKPEFPQSESMGRVSREARLLFIQIWTLVDDSGRARAASRMLASLLYPYDNDAGILMDGWLAELEREGCIVRYSIDGNAYLQVCKWNEHQKIDKPSKSKIPSPRESSRILANPREHSSEDQGSRIKDRNGEDEDDDEMEASSPSDFLDRDEKTAPPPAQIVRSKTLGDFQAISPKAWIPAVERDAWQALISTWGWDECCEAYRETSKALNNGHRVLLSAMTKYLDDHFTLEA